MIELADIKPGEKVYDFGCGKGRLLIEAQRRFCARAVGIEIFPLAYLLAKSRVLMSGVEVGGKCMAYDRARVFSSREGRVSVRRQAAMNEMTALAVQSQNTYRYPARL